MGIYYDSLNLANWKALAKVEISIIIFLDSYNFGHVLHMLLGECCLFESHCDGNNYIKSYFKPVGNDNREHKLLQLAQGRLHDCEDASGWLVKMLRYCIR